MTTIGSRGVRIFVYCGLMILAGAGRPTPIRELPFIENDYPRALAQARSRGLPLLVEGYSVFCPVCRAMAGTVLQEPGVIRFGGKFVWAKLEIGLPENKDFRSRFPVIATPTFLVIEPNSEKVIAKHVGAAEKAELTDFFDDSLKALRGEREGSLDAAFARADGVYGVGKFVEAAKLYQEVLKDAPAGWARRSQGTELWLTALASVPNFPECARVAETELPKLPSDRAFVRSVSIAEYCVSRLPPDHPERQELSARLDPQVQKAIEISNVSAVVHAGLYANLLANRTALKDAEGEKRVARSMLQFLEAARAKAPTALQRSALDGFFVQSATPLKEIQRVLPYLQASERELPRDPASSVTLSGAYANLERYDDALAAIDRAISKAPALTRPAFIGRKAGIYQKKGDFISARQTWDQAIQVVEGLPKSARTTKILAALKSQKVKTLEAEAAAAKVARP